MIFTYSNTFAFVSDVSNTKSFESVTEEIAKHVSGEGLNLLINNAGINLRFG